MMVLAMNRFKGEPSWPVAEPYETQAVLPAVLITTLTAMPDAAAALNPTYTRGKATQEEAPQPVRCAGMRINRLPAHAGAATHLRLAPRELFPSRPARRASPSGATAGRSGGGHGADGAAPHDQRRPHSVRAHHFRPRHWRARCSARPQGQPALPSPAPHGVMRPDTSRPSSPALPARHAHCSQCTPCFGVEPPVG